MTAIDIIQWLGETSLAVSLLILLVLIIRKPFTNAFGARAAYALWLAPAARLFLPELKILPAPQTTAETLAWSTPAAPVMQEAAFPLATVSPAAASFDFASLAAATALVIWATVAFAWFNIKLEAQAKFLNAKLAVSKPATPNIARRAQALAKQFGLKRSPRIRISEDETGPCVVGLFRPVIFLPAAFETDFSERERHLALAHEIAHVARGDMVATLAAIALQSLQWPNPLAHFAFQKFRTDQEAACDAFVLARCSKGGTEAGEYAAAIMKSVRGGTVAPAYGLSLAHPVKERLMLLKNQKKSPLRLLAGAASVVAFTAASLGATASYGFEDAKKDVRIVKDKRVSTKMTIEVDDNETMEIEGVRNPAKVEFENENGVRTVRVYNKRGRLVSENVYGKDEEMPFDEVTIRTKDGESKVIPLDRPHKSLTVELLKLGSGDHDMNWTVDVLSDEDHDVLFLDGDHDVDIVREFAFKGGDGARVMAFGGDMSGHCLHLEGEDAPAVFEWRTEDVDGDEVVKKSGTASFTREIVCLDASEADPEKRAELLRKAIDQMEANAKREAERREKVIAKMREELKEIEEDN